MKGSEFLMILKNMGIASNYNCNSESYNFFINGIWIFGITYGYRSYNYPEILHYLKAGIVNTIK